MEDNPIGYINTMLQYFLHIPDPDSLDDDQWAEKFAQLENIRKKESGQ